MKRNPHNIEHEPRNLDRLRGMREVIRSLFPAFAFGMKALAVIAPTLLFIMILSAIL